MGTSNYSDESKRDAVQQIRVRGYPVREVSQRLGVSSHSLYKWMKLLAEPALKAPCRDNRRCQGRSLRSLLAPEDQRKEASGPASLRA